MASTMQARRNYKGRPHRSTRNRIGMHSMVVGKSMAYRVVTPNTILFFDTKREAMEAVERTPLKRGWTSEWAVATSRRTYFRVFNSKGNLVGNVGAVVIRQH